MSKWIARAVVVLAVAVIFLGFGSVAVFASAGVGLVSALRG
jgi:hypothetical protein